MKTFANKKSARDRLLASTVVTLERSEFADRLVNMQKLRNLCYCEELIVKLAKYDDASGSTMKSVITHHCVFRKFDLIAIEIVQMAGCLDGLENVELFAKHEADIKRMRLTKKQILDCFSSRKGREKFLRLMKKLKPEETELLEVNDTSQDSDSSLEQKEETNKSSYQPDVEGWLGTLSCSREEKQMQPYTQQIFPLKRPREETSENIFIPSREEVELHRKFLSRPDWAMLFLCNKQQAENNEPPCLPVPRAIK